jgi:hypothetical protein
VDLTREVAVEDRPALKQAVRKRMLKGEFPFIQLAAYYLDGKPAETQIIQGDKPLFALILLGERRDPLAPPNALPEATTKL